MIQINFVEGGPIDLFEVELTTALAHNELQKDVLVQEAKQLTAVNGRLTDQLTQPRTQE